MPRRPTLSARVRAIGRALPPGYVWDERELALVDLAEHQAADVELLEADVKRQGARVQSGRSDAQVLNPSLAELRQSRAALAQLLMRLDIPSSASTNTVRAKRAATARWQQQAG